jgi:hypothetical protein
MNPLQAVKPYLWGGALLIAVSLVLSVFFLRNSLKDVKSELAIEKSEKVQAIQTIAKIEEYAAKDRKLLQDYQNVKTEIQYVDKIVIRDVIKYRDVVTTRFVIPSEFVRAYNTSTEPVHSENSTSRTDDPHTALRKIVNDADLLQVITSNNRICVKQAAQLTAFQLWAYQLN